MDNKETEKTPIAVSKSFLAVGPTLHYSHRNVQMCWLLAVFVFGLVCIFWSKISTGSFWSFEIGTVINPHSWRLDKSLTSVVSIFEYPWQIIVLGLLMGALAIAPVLISQLMSFSYSLPLILEIILLANLPGLALCLLISCFAVACRPLRFRSRFIAIALCTAPQLIFWGYFGGVESVEPDEWGFSFAPWICAWLDALVIAGFVIGIGHFTRYRPGLVWIFTFLTLVIAVIAFEVTIGFDELDYQLYVAGNDPELVDEFKDHSITEALDNSINNPTIQKYLQGLYYPTEQTAQRAELIRDIQRQLSSDRWPRWLMLPQELQYQEKRDLLFNRYELFISKRPNSKRMPIALYFKAILSEYSPDLETLGQKELLHFYNDYPHERSAQIWLELYRDFGDSLESLEARWRIASYLAARRGFFEQSDTLLADAETRITERLKTLKQSPEINESFFGLFQSPPDTIMTAPKLNDLQMRIEQLRNLIAEENRTDEEDSINRLSRFILLNQYAINYPAQLQVLLDQTSQDDPLRDNILLARADLISDEQNRANLLNQLHEQYQGTDGGIQALYELGLLRFSLWRQEDSDSQKKEERLKQAKQTLEKFIELYPESFYTELVKNNLEGLPSN